MKSAGGPQWLCRPWPSVVVTSWWQERCSGLPGSRSLGATVIPAAWLILVAPTFLCSFLSLFISSLPVSGWCKTEVCPLCGILRLGRPATHPVPSLVRDTLSGYRVARLASDDAGRMKLAFLSFTHNYSQVWLLLFFFFPLTESLKIHKWTPKLSAFLCG